MKLITFLYAENEQWSSRKSGMGCENWSGEGVINEIDLVFDIYIP